MHSRRERQVYATQPTSPGKSGGVPPHLAQSSPVMAGAPPAGAGQGSAGAWEGLPRSTEGHPLIPISRIPLPAVNCVFPVFSPPPARALVEQSAVCSFLRPQQVTHNAYCQFLRRRRGLEQRTLSSITSCGWRVDPARQCALLRVCWHLASPLRRRVPLGAVHGLVGRFHMPGAVEALCFPAPWPVPSTAACPFKASKRRPSAMTLLFWGNPGQAYNRPHLIRSGPPRIISLSVTSKLPGQRP